VSLTIPLCGLLATLLLVIGRPRIGRWGRLNPMFGTLPGLVVMAAIGALRTKDVAFAAAELARPLLTIASIMTTTSVAHRMGIFDRVTRSIEIRTRGPVPRAFTTVFVIGALCATVFNNDAAILLLTPIVVPTIQRLYPRRPYLAGPFAFAVFMAAGVAPLATSNPMNLVVAERAGIGFNSYAARMVPVALVAAVVSYFAARLAFRSALEDEIPARGREQGSLAPLDSQSLGVLVVVILMLLCYPVLSYFDAPVWVAALGGAVLTTALGAGQGSVTLRDLPQFVAWDVLVFLFGIFLLAIGLENRGLVDLLAGAYGAAGDGSFSQIAVVGGLSALGSAVLNNHPMAALNSLAVAALPGDPQWRTLAALVGGDLGPRLLPMGSLAGLLWMQMARKAGIDIKTGEFIRVGLLTGIPALVASLLTLWLESFLLR
jgi:arsenical pump membrane protein